MSKLNLLVAAPYLTNGVLRVLKKNEGRIRLLLDSGAFTAWKAGRSIRPEAYERVVKTLPIEPWRYFTLDVVGDPEGTKKNYDYLLSTGLRPIPIFTRGDDLALIDEYYKTSDILGVGGLVGTRGNRGFVKGIMRAIGSRKVHWLGFTDLDFIKHFKPFMCDASSWEMGGRYGVAPMYLGAGLPFVKFSKKCLDKLLQDDHVLTALNQYGYSADDFLKPESWRGGRSPIRGLGARSMVRLQKDLEARGTLMFTAATTDMAIEMLLEGL